MITPFNEDGSVDYAALTHLVNDQIDNGAGFICALGTTGETPCLTPEECNEIKRTVVKTVDGRVPVLLGISDNCTARLVNTVKNTDLGGVDGILSAAPSYNKPVQEGIYRHFEAVSRCGLPVIVYNIAGRTGKNISTDLLERIAALPNIAGVKEASGSMMQIMEVIERIARKRPDFSVLSGDDMLTLPAMAAGGDGVISVVSNLAPERVSALVNCLLDGDIARARELHYALAPMFRAAFVDGNPASIKYAMQRKGLLSGKLRLPLVEVHDKAKAVIEQAMRDCGLL